MSKCTAAAAPCVGGEQQRQRSSNAATAAAAWRSLFKWRRSSKLEWGWNPGARGSARGSASEASLLPCAATKEVANVLVEMDSNVVQDRQVCSVCRRDLWLCPEELELSLPTVEPVALGSQWGKTLRVTSQIVNVIFGAPRRSQRPTPSPSS